MTKGQSRFEYYLHQLEELIRDAKLSPDAAAHLYTNDARTLCFMLESLSRLYAELHNKKRFRKMKSHFKQLEDALGDIDHYDAYLKAWQDFPNFPPSVHDYFQQKYSEALQQLNDILLNEYWLSESDNRIEKFRKKLASAKWLSPKKEMKAVLKFYQQEINEVEEFYASTNGSFTQLEEEVHELRRNLRWLSIYAKSMQGAIQLSNRPVSDLSLEPYLTEETIHSPHASLPAPGNNNQILLLEKKYFLALIWMIDALGKLKDEGLKIQALAEALRATSQQTDAPQATATALQLLGKEPNAEQIILTHADQICGDYFKQKMLSKMLKGITEKKNSR